MNNVRVRVAMTENNIRQWELAKLLEMHEASLCRRLREELPAEEQDRIIELIRQHSKTVRGEEQDGQDS